MTIWEILTIIIAAGAVGWWAHSAVFDACEECNYDCNQGRDCPNRKNNPT